MIIDRYIAAQIIRPLLLITVVLGLMFIALSFAALLDKVLAGKLDLSVVATLILLRTLIMLEVLLPSALFVAIIVALRRLHGEGEMMALWSFGCGNPRILRAVILVTVCVALIVASLSLFGRPWAYRNSYQIEEQASLQVDLNRLQSGRFIVLGERSGTLFFDSFDKKTALATGVFVQHKTDKGRRVVRARTMQVRRVGQQLLAHLRDGHLYVLNRGETTGGVLRFRDLRVWLDLRSAEAVRNKRKASASAELWQSDASRDVAELQWRLSAPVSVLLLGILAIPLGRVEQRNHSSIDTILALAAFAVFYGALSSVKTWMEHGVMSSTPGIWIVHLGFLASLLIYLGWRRLPWLRLAYGRAGG